MYMEIAPKPFNEQERIRNLSYYEILDTEAEREFDNLTALASQVGDTPISLVSLVDEERQWIKSKKGLAISETPRDVSFCAHAIASVETEILEVEDTWKDERFHV